MKQNTKEFKRNVCFSFFESYLEQAIAIKNTMNIETAYEYLIAVIEYGLYKKEPENPLTNMLMCGLKNTIDANQERRAQGFNRENTNQTDAILKYVELHPDATQREIANATNCSVGKVNKVLSDNSNDNGNGNNNSNTYTNSNSVSVNVNTPSPNTRKRKRWLDDLTDEELDSIINDYRNRVQYTETKERLSLSYSVTKDTHEDAKRVLKERKEKEKQTKIAKSVEAASNEDIDQIASLFDCEKSKVLEKLMMVGHDVEYVLRWIPIHGNYDTVYSYFQEKTDSYETYEDFLKMFFRCNQLK